MPQYHIQTRDGRVIRADDVRSTEGGMVEYIEPYTHQVKKVWGGDVESVKDIGSSENILGPLGKLFEPKFRR
jgi:hypothetical protein